MASKNSDSRLIDSLLESIHEDIDNDDDEDPLDRSIRQMSVLSSNIISFDIEAGEIKLSNQDVININDINDIKFDEDSIDNLSNRYNIDKNKIKHILIIGGCLIGGAAIGGPLGSLIAARLAVDSTLLMAAGGVTGSAVGVKVGHKIENVNFSKNKSVDIRRCEQV